MFIKDSCKVGEFSNQEKEIGKMTMAKIAAILLVLVILVGLPAQAEMTSIELTSSALGFGSSEINYAKNDSYVEADRIGLVTSLAPNVGSVLTIQKSGAAGSGTDSDPLLVTVTARSHLDIQTGLPAGYDIHGGVITLTAGGTGSPSNQGLGVRAFAIDSSTAARYDDGTGNGFRMEGSKEISGGVDFTSWDEFVAANPSPPKNSPPHVDEDVLFNFNNDLYNIAAGSVNVLLTKINAGSSHNPFDLAIDLKIDLVGGGLLEATYDPLSGAPSGLFSVYEEGGTTYPDVIKLDFGALGLGSALIDSFTIAARDDSVDPDKGTDEHFLINGFYADVEVVPVPGAVILGAIGLGFSGWLGRRKFSD